ncbi:MAG: DUF262 domain-containing protein [candidate division WOR-3 bacterium]|nr:DUF262 domain-containing protein [candidate division WOR-3 bacterium]
MAVNEINLFSLLSEVEKGLIVIPDFQRDFIWKLGQIEELLNSVINGYFIGSILMLESSIDNPRFGIRLIKGVKRTNVDRRNFPTIKYILDGQQRITSLYYAFFEPNEPLSEEDSTVFKFYLKVDTLEVYGLKDPKDIVNRLRNITSERLRDQIFRSYEEVYKNTYGIDIRSSPSMGIFKDEKSFENYLKNANLTSEGIRELENLFKKIQDYTVPVIILPDNISNKDLVNTFERINRTGTPLNIFELAVARYYPLGINLNQLKEFSFKICRPSLLPLPFDEVDVLKVIAILKEREPKSQNLLDLVENHNEERRIENVAEFNDLWETAVEYLTQAWERVREIYGGGNVKLGNRKIRLIPYTTMLVPLAVMLYEIEQGGETAELYKKVDFWYWCSVFSQRYSHGVDAKSFSDVKLIKEWFEDSQKIPNILPVFEFVKEEMLKASRTSALAKGFYNLLILNNPKDLLTGQPITLTECQVDHIFPKSQFGREADNIFNLTIISTQTNQIKGDSLPSEFLERCFGSHGNNENSLEETFESHFISKDALRALEKDDLDKFIQIRSEYFINVLKKKLSF